MKHPYVRTIFILFSFLNLSIFISTPAFASQERATILLSLQPQKENGKKWDIGKGADPVICLKNGCYIGRGFVAPAKFYKGKKALFPFIQARACSNSLACIYRNVHIPGKEGKIRPIDLDGFKTDKMQARKIEIDYTCHIENDQLNCLNGIYTSEYSIWVVPENIASQAGKRILDYALFKGVFKAREKQKLAYLRHQRRVFPEVANKFFYAVRGKPTPSICELNADVLVEVFYIAGIFPNSSREQLTPLATILTSNSPVLINHSTTKIEHSDFWLLRKAIEKIKQYAYADRFRLVKREKGLRLLQGVRQTTLLVGWDVKSRADNVITGCSPDSRTE